jgi:hypothetical protein
MFWLDAYERRARLVPGMLLVAPIAVVIVMFGLRSNPVVAAILGALTTFGAPVVLANYVRHRGLAVQEELYQSWGGKPTTRLLQAGRTARELRWRQAAAEISGEQFPEPGELDPAGNYDAAVAVLISRTRSDKRFRMVFNENRNYGYERNLYGLRKQGRFVSALCLASSGVMVGLFVVDAEKSIRAEWVIGLIALAGFLLLWLLLPSSDRVRATAEKYAEQLLDAGVEVAGTP